MGFVNIHSSQTPASTGSSTAMRDPLLQDRAREMRKHLPDSEVRLWQQLRRKQIDGYKFRRQYQIGPFIADFASIQARLVVEIDGDQHGNDRQQMRDATRTDWLERHGWRVIRFWSSELADMDAVEDAIREACQNPTLALPR